MAEQENTNEVRPSVERRLVCLRSGENRIYGTASLVEDGAAHPALILMHGLTGNRDERLLVGISKALERAGMNSIRFDFNGHGESEGDPEQLTVRSEIRDCETVLDYMRSLPEVDSRSIFLAGHSVGGLDAVYVAAGREQELRGIITISPAMTLYHELVEGLQLDRLRDATAGRAVDFGGFPIGSALIEESAFLDAFGEARKVHLPALLIHGDNDQDTPAFNSVMLEKIWKGHARLCLVPGADHCYRSVAAEQEVSRAVVDFMRSV